MTPDNTHCVSPVEAKLSAKIFGRLGGDDSGLLIVGVILLILTLGGLGFETYFPTIASKLCVGLGLAGICGVVLRWSFYGSNKLVSDGIPVKVDVVEQNISVDTIVRDKHEAVSVLRAIIQGRKALPDPHGEVLGSPTDTTNLREYSEGERDRVAREINEAAFLHDKQLINQLRRIERQLPPSNVLPAKVIVPAKRRRGKRRKP